MILQKDSGVDLIRIKESTNKNVHHRWLENQMSFSILNQFTTYPILTKTVRVMQKVEKKACDYYVFTLKTGTLKIYHIMLTGVPHLTRNMGQNEKIFRFKILIFFVLIIN